MITKLPNYIDPTTMIAQEIKNRYGSKCPCCGESRHFLECHGTKGIMSYGYISWYGKDYEKDKLFCIESFNPKNWFKRNHHWRVDSYTCETCGAKWDTPAYPTDVLTSEEVDEIWRNLNG